MKPARHLLALALLALPAAAQETPAGPAAPAEKPAPPAPAAELGAEEKVIEMEAFKVRGNPVSNFAITVQVFMKDDGRRMQLIVSKVAFGSDAERLGLRAGDEIIRIGGLVVAEMEPDVGKDSPLGRLLLNRRPGDILDLEFISHQPRAVKLRASSWSGVNLGRPEPKVDAPAPVPGPPAALQPKN